MPLDRPRFIYSLAGELVAGQWTVAETKAVLKRGIVDRPLRVPKLAERIHATFPDKPEFAKLAAFLRSDAGLLRAIDRPIALPTKRVLRSIHPSRVPRDDPPRWLNGIVLPQLATERVLADWFGIDVGRLKWRTDIAGRNRKHPPGPLRTYRYRWIPKREGVPRLLEIPKTALKQMQRKILAEILDPVPVHPAAHGFCPGRSIITNAAAHVGKSTVLRFDLVDFFPSISSARIFRIFRTLGYPIDVSRLLMGVCTTRLPPDVWDARPCARIGGDFPVRQCLTSRHLPQGAPTSPALANLAAARLDRRLIGLAKSAGATYTRYADDLTFSGDSQLARSHKRFATHVALIAYEEGFALNHRKTRMMRTGVRQMVTGVVVNIRPNIKRSEFDRMKAILTNCIRHGAASQNRDQHADFRAFLAGKVAHINSIHAARGRKLLDLFNRISWSTANPG